MEKFIAIPSGTVVEDAAQEEFTALNDAIDYGYDILRDIDYQEAAEVEIYKQQDDGEKEYCGTVFWTEPEIIFTK